MHDSDAANNGQQAGMPGPGPIMDGPVAYDSLFQIFWRGRWLILLAVAVALGGAYLYLRTATPLYESTARVLVDRPGLQAGSDVPQPAGSTSNNYLQTQASMMTSREIIMAALRDPNVVTLPTLRETDYPVEEVIRSLNVSVGKNTDIVHVTAKSAYPQDAAAIVNAVVRAYRGWHAANKQLSTSDLLRDLNSQLQKRYEELRAKRQERMMFEQRNPKVVENSVGGMGSKTIELLKQDLAAARVNTIEQESYRDGLQRFADDPNQLRQYVYGRRTQVTVPADERERMRLEEELFATEQQLEQFAKGGSMQQMALVQNRRTQLQERIASLDKEFVQKQIALGQALAQDAVAREKQLKDMYDNELAEFQSLGGQNAEYTFIVSECEMIQNLCDSLLSQINALDINASFERLSIHVLEPALPATEPSSPQVAQVLGIAAMLGLMLGAGLALLRDWRDQRLRSTDEITAMLGVPVLGVVPSIRKRGMSTRAQTVRFAPDSRESESYRAIRTALFFGPAQERTMAILVTSPDRLEGKTTLVSNLGIAMAHAGQRTIIIDADLRRPMQREAFAIKGHDYGLTNVLTGSTGLAETVHPTGVRGLDVLAAGGHVPNPSELLGGQPFTQLLGELKESYDRILIDSPPVGIVTDAQILAAHCELTLLVLRAGQSSRAVTQRAMAALLAVRARLVGVVINDVSRRDRRYSVPTNYYGYAPNGHEREDAGLPADIRWEVLNTVIGPEANKPPQPPQPPEPDPTPIQTTAPTRTVARPPTAARPRKTTRRRTAADDTE